MPTNKKNVIAGLYDAFAYEKITVADSALGFTTATLDDAQKVMATVETAQIRVRYDGTAPTATEGHILEIGDVIQITGSGNIKAFKAIRTGAVSGILRVTYER